MDLGYNLAYPQLLQHHKWEDDASQAGAIAWGRDKTNMWLSTAELGQDQRSFRWLASLRVRLHIALEVEQSDLEPMLKKARERGIETRGPSDHGMIESIYFLHAARSSHGLRKRSRSARTVHLEGLQETIMIILHASLRVATGKRDETITALEALVETSRAETGCLAFSVAFDLFDDHLLRVVEAFQDESAWAAHQRSAHVAEWQTAASLLGVSDLELRRYNASAN